MKNLILVDGNPLMWRAAFGKGEEYVAQGIVSYFFSILNKFPGADVLLFWDSGKSRWRSEYYPDYKIHRDKKKSEFDLHEMEEQKKSAQRFLSFLGVRSLSTYGVEADDLIGWFSMYFDNYDKTYEHVIIATRDRDLWQLINDNVFIYDPLDDKLINKNVCEQEFGVPPEKIVVYKSLVGDVSDNLVGVKGVGDKSALKLIDKYGDIGTILNPDNKKEINKSKIASKALTQCESFELTNQLVRLPALNEAWSYLNADELRNLITDINKTVESDPFEVQIESEVLGLSHVPIKSVSSLPQEIKGIEHFFQPKVVPYLNSIKDLDKRINSCLDCPLYESCVQGPVLSTGYLNVDIMLIGRSPTVYDLESRTPFSGEEGALIDQFLNEVGLERSHCWVTNVCKCYTPGNRPPTYGEIQACSRYLKKEIEFIKPKFIITFGNEAMSLVTPYKSGVTKHVGEVLDKPENSLGYIGWVGVMVHPLSALISTQGEANFEYGTTKIKEFLDSRRE